MLGRDTCQSLIENFFRPISRKWMCFRNSRNIVCSRVATVYMIRMWTGSTCNVVDFFSFAISHLAMYNKLGTVYVISSEGLTVLLALYSISPFVLRVLCTVLSTPIKSDRASSARRVGSRPRRCPPFSFASLGRNLQCFLFPFPRHRTQPISHDSTCILSKPTLRCHNSTRRIFR